MKEDLKNKVTRALQEDCMKVNLNEIKLILNNMLDRAKEIGFEEIDINADCYWVVTADDRINFEIEKPNLCVGSLIDDYNELSKALNGVNPYTVVDFDRVASIIVEIGNEISNSDTPYC
jgi:hypothetical protein